MNPPDADFAGPNLHAAALMLMNYGKDHGMTPRELIDVFYEGVQVVAGRTTLEEAPAWLRHAVEVCPPATA